jgi:hypothetical protein
MGLVRRERIADGIDEVLDEVECINGDRWWTRARPWVRKSPRWSPEKPVFDHGAHCLITSRIVKTLSKKMRVTDTLSKTRVSRDQNNTGLTMKYIVEMDRD